MLRPENNKKTKNLSVIVSAVLFGAAIVLLFSARRVEGFAEWYCNSIYKFLLNSVGRFSGFFTFSLSEVLVFLIPVLLIIDALHKRKRLSRFLQHLILLLAAGIFLYSANCGVNYYRDPFISPEKYSDVSFTVEQLADFCEYTARQLQQSSGETAASEFIYPDDASIASSAVSAMKTLGNEYGSLSGYYPEPKKLSAFSGIFSGMGVSGIYSPFTIEANTNGEMPGMEKPFTACHELSHLKGYMNEGEANYIGWLACIGSDDPAFKRSGWLIAWNYAGNALYRSDPERFKDILTELPVSAVKELQQNHDFWKSRETKASEVQDKVNDAYLKSNGQKDGISSYGKLTTLMLIWYTSNHGFSD